MTTGGNFDKAGAYPIPGIVENPNRDALSGGTQPTTPSPIRYGDSSGAGNDLTGSGSGDNDFIGYPDAGWLADPESRELAEQLRMQYSWMPEAALQVFIAAYINHGADVAWSYVRADKRYEEWFPGNMDDDGNIRYDESMYAGVRESYRDVFRSVGLDPDQIALLEEKVIQLMEGEVSPQELNARVSQVYNQIVASSDGVRQYYADMYGIEGLEVEDLLLAALDPDLGDLVLEQGVRVAEVGGAALDFGYGLDPERVQQLVGQGLSAPQARQLFGDAYQLIPVLDTLAKRHNDPDDDFDINEFLSSEVFRDPTQNLRMRRLQARERSLYTRTGRFAAQGEAITGLTAG